MASPADAHFLLAMPKVELHLHLEGAVTPELALSLAEANGIAPPFETVEAGTALYRAIHDFDSFKHALLRVNRCMRRARDFERVMLALGNALLAQNVKYAEVHFSPLLHMHAALLPWDMLDALNSARRALHPRGLELRWIPDIVRSYPGPASTIAHWAASDHSRAGGVVALGLTGSESSAPASDFEPIFALARSFGLAANPHAGEGADPEAVREAIRALKPSRIGHGISAVNDTQLLAELTQSNVTLEICPTSNVRLGVCADYASHPLRRIVEAGCKTTLSTDDPALFSTTLTDEYQHAVSECGLSVEQLEQTVDNGVAASHLSDSERAALREAVQSDRVRLKGIASGHSAAG